MTFDQRSDPGSRLTRQYSLREPTERDIDVYATCFSDPSWVESYYFCPSYSDPREHARQVALRAYPDVVRRVVCLNQRPIGFFTIHLANRTRNEGVLLGGVLPSLRFRGVGPVVPILALEFSFGVLELDRVVCSVFGSNSNTIRLLTRLGFSVQKEVAVTLNCRGQGIRCLNKLELAMVADEFPTAYCSMLLRRYSDA